MTSWPEIGDVVQAPEMIQKNVHAYLAGDVPETVPRDSATVVLLRPSETGPEVYLQQRAATMGVSAGQLVFPGGLVDASDFEVHAPWAGPTIDEWARRLGGSIAITRAIVTAAVRETFEESGVLLAATSDGAPARQHSTWESMRQELVDRSITFAEFLRRHSLVLRSDLLHEVTRWITPAWARQRFDTRFFVAALPEGQQPLANHESDLDIWIGLGDVIDRASEGDLALMYPTLATLKNLAGPSEVEGILAAPRDAGPHEFVLVSSEGSEHAVFVTGPSGPAYAYSIGAPAVHAV